MTQGKSKKEESDNVMELLSASKWITPPESGNLKGLTSIDLNLRFQGKEIYLNDEIEGVHPEWADALIEKLQKAFAGGQ